MPLAEDSERYEVDVMDGATVKRTIAASVPSAGYTAAQQIADFGSVQASGFGARASARGCVWARECGERRGVMGA